MREKIFSLVLLDKLLSLVFVVGATVLAYRAWHEDQRAKSFTRQVLNQAVDVKPESPHYTSNEGKTLFLQGTIQCEELVDQAFGIRVEGLALQRVVERMTRQKVRRDEKTTWEVNWTEGDQGNLNQYLHWPHEPRLGPFTLSPDLLDSASAYLQPLELDSELSFPEMAGFTPILEDNYVVYRLRPDKAWTEGDIRVSFKWLPTEITLFARQEGRQLERIVPEAGDYISLVRPGKWTKESLLEQAAQQTIAKFLWVLSGVAGLIGLLILFKRR